VSELPSWIDNRLDQNLDNALSQKHVVETMVDSERPFFSARQLQALVKLVFAHLERRLRTIIRSLITLEQNPSARY